MEVRLAAMEREIAHLTSTHTIDFKPKKNQTTRIASQRVILTSEEIEKQGHWPRDVDMSFQKELVAISSGKRRKINRNQGKRRMRGSASAPNLSSENSATSAEETSREERVESTPTKLRQKHVRRKRTPKLVPIGGGLGPRFPRANLSGVMNGPTPQHYNVKGSFGSHPGGEMVQTFAWDETRDRDWFQEGAFWDLRMKALASERLASMQARKEAAKKRQSRRLVQQAKDELKDANTTDRKWAKTFINELEMGETLSFSYVKAGQIGTKAEGFSYRG